MNRAITWGMHCFWAHLYVHISKEVSLPIDCYFWMNFLLNITGISVGSPVNEDFPKPTDILWRLENQPLWSSRYVFFSWNSVIQQKIMLIMGTLISYMERCGPRNFQEKWSSNGITSLHLDQHGQELFTEVSQILAYPLVNVYIAMDNHYFLWENPLFLWPFSIATLNYQRVIFCYTIQVWWNIFFQGLKMIFR